MTAFGHSLMSWLPLMNQASDGHYLVCVLLLLCLPANALWFPALEPLFSCLFIQSVKNRPKSTILSLQRAFPACFVTLGAQYGDIGCVNMYTMLQVCIL
jgi:hypothetical protein